MSELPSDWEKSTLGKVCEKPQYGWTTKAVSEGSVRLLRTTDITSGSINWESVPFCRDEPEDSEKYLLKHNDIVVSRAGSVGVSHLVQNPGTSVFASYLIRFKPLIDPKYVAFFLQSPSYWNAITEKSAGIALQNVNATKLREIEIPVAPLPEQRRIVARIEELFSRLDAGVAALRHAKAQLQRYRQSVLAAAVTGQLTQAWREQNPDTEPAKELLERILEVRRQTWSGRGKYKEGAEAKDSLPFDHPDSWAVASFDQISSQVTVGHVGSMKDKYRENGIPFLRSQNVRPMRFAPENLVFIDSEFDAGLAKSRLYGGEILLTRSGANVGQCCVYPKVHGEANCSDLVITRPLEDINPRFGALYMNSPQGRKMLHLNKVGAAQAHFNVGSMKVAPLPLPPLAEQHQIVAEVEARTTAIDHLEAELDHQITRSNRLRQSTLASAFCGQL